MKAIQISTSVFTFLILTCAASIADTEWVIPSDQQVSAVQRVLKGDLAMPGVGLDASKKQIMKRLEYALEHEWLTIDQVDLLKADLKVITDKEESQRDETGELSFESKMSLARNLFKLNAKFEEMALREEKHKLRLSSRQ